MRGEGGLGKNLETLVPRGRHLQKLGEECLFKAIAMK
jgi:hypothetical protein